MKAHEFVKAMRNYFNEIYLAETPKLPIGVHSDLHIHPYIHDDSSLEHTLQVMHNNGLDLLAITTHGAGNGVEFDYWEIKRMIRESDLEQKFKIQDKGRSFSLRYKDKKLYFIPAYEMYVYLPGVQGRIDIISLMPEKGFEKVITAGLQFDEHKKINDDYGAIAIGAHPFTL